MAIQKVTSDLIADDAVTAAKIANNTITATQLANNSIGVAQLNLSDGSDGQFLKTNGSGTLSFAAAGGGGGRWTQIAKTTLNPASAVGSIEFTSFVNAAYSEYEVRWSGFGTNSSGNEVDLYVQLGLTGFNSAAYQSADYSVETWYNSPVYNSTGILQETSRVLGYFKLSKVYGQWKNYPKSFGRFNFTNDGSMVSWECNMHAGARNSSPDDRMSLHRNWGLGYHWGSGGNAAIEKIKFYDGGTNRMTNGTFAIYGLEVT